MPPTLRRASIALAAIGMAYSVCLVAADNAFIRASEGILMSRNMDTKDRVAARGLWTIARKENPEEAASAQAAMPALRIALGDSSVSVAMNAVEALERLGEPVAALAEVRRKALRTPGPYAYERFLAARGLTAIDPATALTPFVLDFLFDEHRRAGSRDSTGARDNIRIANAALSRLVQTGDRGVLNTLERELATARPGTADLLRAMAVAKPPPDHFVRTLVIESEAPDAEVVATAYQLMGKLDASADLTEWVPAAARALQDPRRQGSAARALSDVAGKTALGMPELARLSESNAPEAVRVTALAALASASDATRDRAASVLAAAKPPAFQAFRSVLARERAGPVFEEAARGLRFTERDFSKTAAMYLEALKQNPDAAAQAHLLDYIAQAHGAAGPLADELRPYANAGDPKVRRAAIAALDSVKPLVALGADPEQRASDGSTMLDYANAACAPEVQQALLGRLVTSN